MSRPIAFLLGIVLLIVLVPAASAAPPRPVDPSTLTPPPNPNFDWRCTSNGQRIDCDGVETIVAVEEPIDPSFSCGGQPILTTFTQVVRAHRTHDAQGRVIRNHMVGTFDEVWSLEGSDGTLNTRGRWSASVDYAVPGDVTSRINTYSGQQVTAWVRGGGVIFQNTGHVVANWDESELLSIHGPQDFYEDFDAAIAAACVVLLAR